MLSSLFKCRGKCRPSTAAVDDVKLKLGGKKVGLFGSYGWGSGEWMESWAEDAKMSHVALAADPVIANDEPDDDAKSACEALGAALV